MPFGPTSALYVAGYAGFRIFEETLRIDPSHRNLGLRLNFFGTLPGPPFTAWTPRACEIVAR